MPRSRSKPDAERLRAEQAGRRAEWLAALYLRFKLFRIIATRLKTPVARIAHAAEWFMMSNPQFSAFDCRFDVVVLTPGRWPHHLENAFSLS